MNLVKAVKAAYDEMEGWGDIVHTEKWQAMDIAHKPEAQMVEVLHYRLVADLEGELHHEAYADGLEPNLPWADNHFEERICGFPLNPGTEWKNWPWGNSADTHRDNEKFNHNYMERYWPKHAGQVKVATQNLMDYQPRYVAALPPLRGIYHEYGDLNNLIDLLAKEPSTRQAYMPIWFPEDTGTTHSGRKPCTLGYHFIMRKGRLDIRYDIRSCDMYRHFRDDIYLTIRLGLHILERCKEINPEAWHGVVLGNFIMNITSLHMFINDYRILFKHNPE